MWSQLPIVLDELEAYRIAARRSRRANLIGSHLQRRRGQSLEFEEFLPYVVGNDSRHIDWRASLRYRGRNDLLVRHFRAEERMQLVVSLDDRATMRLPLRLPKVQLALWLAEAVGWVALRSGYQVAFHRLFGGESAEFRSKREISTLPTVLHTLLNTHPQSLNLATLHRLLPPTAVWLIITDLYFDSDIDRDTLIERINIAQDGYRIVILIEIDAWPFERGQLGNGVSQVEGPGLTIPDARFDMRTTLQIVDERIEQHRRDFLRQLVGPAFAHVRWVLPPRWASEEELLLDVLEQDVIKQLFMRDSSS